MTHVLVTGAGGFIAPYQVSYLKDRGHTVRSANPDPPSLEEAPCST